MLSRFAARGMIWCRLLRRPPDRRPIRFPQRQRTPGQKAWRTPNRQRTSSTSDPTGPIKQLTAPRSDCHSGPSALSPQPPPAPQRFCSTLLATAPPGQRCPVTTGPQTRLPAAATRGIRTTRRVALSSEFSVPTARKTNRPPNPVRRPPPIDTQAPPGPWRFQPGSQTSSSPSDRCLVRLAGVS